MKTTTTVFRYAFRFLAVAGLACGLASATTIEATGVDWARGQSIWIQEDGVDKSAYFAGVILITVTDGGQQYSRDSLCVDLFTDININTVYDTTILHPYQVAGQEPAEGIMAGRQCHASDAGAYLRFGLIVRVLGDHSRPRRGDSTRDLGYCA